LWVTYDTKQPFDNSVNLYGSGKAFSEEGSRIRVSGKKMGEQRHGCEQGGHRRREKRRGLE